jgi:hypothetical protein
MIDKDTLLERLSRIGESIKAPMRICIIGSGASLLAGQPSRATPDIDVWRDASEIDIGAFRSGCLDAGLLFDPAGEVPDDAEYVQIVRTGVVSLPKDFPVGITETFGNLQVFTPPLGLIAALKLARGSETDFEDAAWIIDAGHATVAEIREWSSRIPDGPLSEASLENVVILELISIDKNSESDIDNEP